MSKVWLTLSFLWWWGIISGCAPATPTALTTAAAQFMESARLTHGPVVGAVTPDAARVFVRTDRPAQVQIMYWTDPRLEFALLSDVQTTADKSDWTAQIPLKGLKPNTVYYLNVLVDNVPQSAQPLAQFKTFPPKGAATDLKFVFLTDMHSPTEDLGAFNAASLENPDFVLISGDMGREDQNSLDGKRDAYKELYDPNPYSMYQYEFVRKILRQFPVAHAWDDHDFGGNNANKTYPNKQLSYQVLTEYFPTYELAPFGDWQKFTFGQAEFFLLDSRSQRDLNHQADGPDKSMLDGDNLGAAGQLEWLKQGLLNSTATWKFIVTPVPFNLTLAKSARVDSWYGFQYERAQLIKFIRDHKISGVILLSGDAHFGAIDDGTNSEFPEMLTPSPSLLGCASAKNPGKWSEGAYWSKDRKKPCSGYGLVSVQADPPQVKLEVKDTQGNTKLKLNVNP